MTDHMTDLVTVSHTWNVFLLVVSLFVRSPHPISFSSSVDTCLQTGLRRRSLGLFKSSSSSSGDIFFIIFSFQITPLSNNKASIFCNPSLNKNDSYIARFFLQFLFSQLTMFLSETFRLVTFRLLFSNQLLDNYRCFYQHCSQRSVRNVQRLETS